MPAELRLIPGIEMSATGESSSCHILGYGINIHHQPLQKKLHEFRQTRIARMQAIIERLKSLGVVISFERVQALAGKATIGRPHLADALVEQKIVRSRKEAFQRYLSHNGPAYVEGYAPSSKEVITLIHEAGGVSVLAHPAFYCNEDYLKQLVHEGLMGLEVYYPDVSRALRERFLTLAKQFQLLVTGGSDYHGPRTGRSELACITVPEEILQQAPFSRV